MFAIQNASVNPKGDSLHINPHVTDAVQKLDNAMEKTSASITCFTLHSLINSEVNN